MLIRLTIGGGASLALALLASGYYLYAALLAAAVGAMMILSLWPMLGIYAIIACEAIEPLRNGISALGGLTVPKLIAAALVGLVLIDFATGRSGVRKFQSRLWYPILALTFICGLSLLVNGVNSTGTSSTIDLMSAIVLFALILANRNDLNLTSLFRVIAGSITFVCLAQFFFNTANSENGRLSGLSGDPNYFGMLLTASIPLSAYLAVSERNPLMRALWWISLPLQVHAVLGTMSRASAVVLVLTGLAALAMCHRHLRPKHYVIAGSTAFILLLTSPLWLPPDYLKRFESIAAVAAPRMAHADRSIDRRQSYWIVGGRMLMTSPLIGTGPGSYPSHFARSEFASAYSSRLEEESHFRRAHNTYLETASELGLLGLSAFVIILATTFRQLLHSSSGARSSRPSWEDRQIIAVALSLGAVAASLFLLSAIDHKYLWSLIAASTILYTDHSSPNCSEGTS